MRGRRRGRNRPSPTGPLASESVDSPSSEPRGAVKVLASSDAGSEAPDDLARTDATDVGTDKRDVVQASEVSSDSPTFDSVDANVKSTVQTSALATDSPEATSEAVAPVPAEPAVVTTETEPETETKATATTATPDKAEVASEERAISSEKSPASTGTASAPAGRQPQAASGNPLPRILAVANQKGGVGKTTTSVNLGAALAELGFRVLVIDLDPQGNATTGLGIDARNFELSMYDVLMRDSSLEDCVEPTSMKNLFVAPATIALAGAEIELVPAFSREMKLKRAIESVIDDFDYVLIDCPPSLGLITVNALAAADEVLVPIQCEYYALEGLSQLMRNVHLVASNLNPRLDISTIVLTMYDARTKLSDQVATEVREHFGNKVCRIVIPRTVRLSEAPSFGQPITAFDPASRGAIAYRELAKEVSGGTS